MTTATRAETVHRSRWRDRRDPSAADGRGQSRGAASRAVREALGQNHLWPVDPGRRLGDPGAASADACRHAGRLSYGGLWDIAFPPLHRPAQGHAKAVQLPRRSRATAGPHAPNSIAASTSPARRSRGACACSTAMMSSRSTILLPNPFLSPDADKVLKTPDWSRLELWDRLRARWLGADRARPFDRSGRGFSHG